MATHDQDEVAELTKMCTQWKRDLKENVLPFWLKHSLDTECGGYFTTLDRDGSLLDTTKYQWLQGREVWTFSRMHNCSGLDASDAEREQWYQAALVGAKFMNKAKREDGLLFFSTTREGEGVHFQRRPYTAVFYILASLEFYQAIKIRQAAGKQCDQDPEQFKNQARNMFAQFRLWIDDPTMFGRPKPPSNAKPMSALGEVMCLAGLSEEMIAKFPEDAAQFLPDVEEAMRRVVLHYDNKRHILMETADPVLGVTHDTMQGRFFNPGHSIEVAWFLMHLCKLKPSESHEKMALEILEGSLEAGWDKEHGGILYMMDILNKPILDTTVTAEGKLWWPHCEALYACTMAYIQTGDKKWFAWLKKVHEYTYDHFYDGVDKEGGGGEWFGYLRKDGTVFNHCKGGNYKGCFHVPRTLLYCTLAVEKFLKK